MRVVAESADEHVDVFVWYLNAAGFEPKLPDGLPEELRTSHPVQSMDASLAPSWSLINRYRFCNFEIGPLLLVANSGLELLYELADRVFGLFPTLHKNGFGQLRGSLLAR
jgi:hypothetical protein